MIYEKKEKWRLWERGEEAAVGVNLVGHRWGRDLAGTGNSRIRQFRYLPDGRPSSWLYRASCIREGSRGPSCGYGRGREKDGYGRGEKTVDGAGDLTSVEIEEER